MEREWIYNDGKKFDLDPFGPRVVDVTFADGVVVVNAGPSCYLYWGWDGVLNEDIVSYRLAEGQ